jgi:phage/plasmid-associated DNA primase
MDTIGQFLRDCCLLKTAQPEIKTKSSTLYDAFCRWSGEHLTQKAFSERLLELGYTKTMGGDGRMYWHGIGLIVGTEDDQA